MIPADYIIYQKQRYFPVISFPNTTEVSSEVKETIKGEDHKVAPVTFKLLCKPCSIKTQNQVPSLRQMGITPAIIGSLNWGNFVIAPKPQTTDSK